jgi:hypothetical protein
MGVEHGLQIGLVNALEDGADFSSNALDASAY